MVIYVHAFDWIVYRNKIMPAFERWLIERDVSLALPLFEKTRLAQEERFLPSAMHGLRIWQRATSFVDTLPQGFHSRREYQLLCSAELFTSLGDRYMYSHIPQLYHQSKALCALWNALVEEYCLPWNQDDTGEEVSVEPEPSPLETAFSSEETDTETTRYELVSLLNAAGLSTLANTVPPLESPPIEELADDDTDDDEDADQPLAEGETMTSKPPQAARALGRHPNTLRLRGWLAGTSLHALVLFEYLACERRGLPFGTEIDESRSTFRGYLTPAEVLQLAACLEGTRPPSQVSAEHDYHSFRLQQANQHSEPRLIDEVLPTHASNLLEAVQQAAAEGLGLICSLDN